VIVWPVTNLRRSRERQLLTGNYQNRKRKSTPWKEPSEGTQSSLKGGKRKWWWWGHHLVWISHWAPKIRYFAGTRRFIAGRFMSWPKSRIVFPSFFVFFGGWDFFLCICTRPLAGWLSLAVCCCCCFVCALTYTGGKWKQNEWCLHKDEFHVQLRSEWPLYTFIPANTTHSTAVSLPRNLYHFLSFLSFRSQLTYQYRYTSVGNRGNTKPNAALRVVDPGTGLETYRPAYLLPDCMAERQGRLW
jgi:hypothetical protein